MNKIFKVVWSKTKNCYVVTSELAKQHTKSNQTKSEVSSEGGRLSEFGSAALRATLAAAVLTGAMGLSQTVDAAYTKVEIENGNVGDEGFTDTHGKEAVALNPRYDGDTAGSQSGRVGYKSVAIGTMALAENQSVAVGYQSEAKGDGSITMGTGAIVTGWNGVKYKNDSTWSSYIKDNAKEHTGSAIDKSIVIGAGSFISPNPFGLAGGADSFYDSGQGVVLGSSSVGTSQATAVGNNVYAVGRSSIAIGSDDTASYRDLISEYDYNNYFKAIYNNIDPYGHTYGYLKDGVTAVTTKGDPNQYVPTNRIYSPTLAQGDGSIAIGSRSLANAAGSTALGTLAFALQKGSTAIGTVTRAEGEGALAFGNNTYVFANNAIGVGSKSQVLNTGGTAYGYKTYSAGNNAIAIGRDVYANVSMTAQKDGTRDVFTSSGKYNFDPTKGARSILDGVSIGALGLTGMLATGETDSSVTYDKALEQLVAKNAASDSTVGLGFLTANTAEKNGVANVVTTSGENAIVLGSRSVATGSNGISLGRGAISLADNSFALGSYSMSTSKNSIALGLASRTTGNNSLAIGTASAALGNNSLSVGAGTLNYGTDTTVVGTRSGVIDNVKDSVVLGSRGIIGKGIQNSLAIGTNASVGNYLINDEDLIVRLDPTTGSLPINPTTRKPYTTEEYRALIASKGYTEATKITGIEANRSFILDNADANGNGLVNAIAIGNDARVFSKATGTNLYTTSTERGVYEGKVLATEDGRNAMAIGNGAQAWLENSLALGVNSKTDYTPKQLAAEAWRTPDAIAVSTTSNVGVISVGSVGGERRIVNLAAGAYDTDAVNVSQLKQMYDTIQRQVNGGDDLQGLHYLSTKSGTIASGETDYVMKNNAQVAYTRYVNTLKEYKSYLLKEAFGGAHLTEEAKKGYNAELTKLEARLVENGVSRETLDNNLKIRTYTKSDHTVVTTDEITRDPETHAITGVTVNKAAMGDNVTVTDAINALEGNLETDLGVLDNNNNAITGLTSDAIEQGLNSINYNNSLATGKGSVAIGYKTAASSDYSTAIGAEALASGATDAGLGATAVGAKSKATAKNTLAVGQGAAATRENALAIGVSANVKGGSMAVGNWAEIPNAGSTNSVAVGQGAKMYGDVDESVTVGAYSRIGDEASTSTRTITGATSVGSNSVVAGDGGTAIGHRTNIALTASNATAIGKEATVAKANSVAIGYNSTVLSSDDGSSQGRFYGDVPTTAGVTAPTLGVVSFGNGSDTRRLIHVAAGIDATDAVNVAQLQSLANQTISFYTDKGETEGIQAPLGKLSATRGNNDTYEGPGFYLKGGAAGDIKTTSKAGSGDLLPTVTFDLIKADAVESGETKAVTGDAVYKAIEAAKDEVTAAKTTVKAKADTPITVEPATTGAAEYTVGFDADAAEAATKLTYQAGTSGTNEVALSTGLNFQEGTAGTVATGNLELTSAAGGAVNIGLKKDLTNLTSVGGASGSGKLIFGASNTLDANGGRLTNLANGTGKSDAATVGQVAELAKDADLKYGIRIRNPLGDGSITNASRTSPLSKGITFAQMQSSNTSYSGNASRNILFEVPQQDALQGFVNVGLSPELVNITSIGLNDKTQVSGTRIGFGTDTITLTSGLLGATEPGTVTLTGLKDGTKDADAATYHQVTKGRTQVAGTGAITVTPDATGNNDGVSFNKYTVSVDNDALQKAAKLSYKANSAATANKVTLDAGLNFLDGKNTSASTNTNGTVTFSVADNLTGITSIGLATGTTTGAKMTFAADSISLSSGNKGETAGGVVLHGLADGKEATDAATVGQLSKGLPTVVAGDYATVTSETKQKDGVNYKEYKVAVNKADLVTDLGSNFAKVDASNISSDNATKWRTALDVYSKAGTDAAIKTARTTVTTTTNGGLFVIQSVGNPDTHNAYTIAIDEPNLRKIANIEYTANSNTSKQVTTLANGFNFLDGTNTTASVDAAGKVTYSVKPDLTGIKSITGDGQKVTLGATGINVGSQKITGVAAGGTDDTDAVNFGQLKAVKDVVESTTIGNEALNTKINALDGTIQLGGNSGTTDQVSIKDDINFTIKGDAAGDITTTAANQGVTLKLNKTTSVTNADDKDKVVTSGGVYTAVTGAKTKVALAANDDSGILTVAKTSETTDLTANSYTLGINKANLKTAMESELGTTFAKVDASNIGKNMTSGGEANAATWRTALDVYSKDEAATKTEVNNGRTTVALKAGEQALVLTDGGDATKHAYELGLNATKVASAVSLSYKADGESGVKTTTLSDGLTFKGDSNVKVATQTGGVVQYTLNSALTGIASITGSNNSKIDLSTTGSANFGGMSLDNIKESNNTTSAATVGQLETLKSTVTNNNTTLNNAVNDLKDNTVALFGDDKATTDKNNAQPLSSQSLSFSITGNDDITTTTTDKTTTAGNGVSLALNKITDAKDITASATRPVSGQAVYSAVTGAKTEVKTDGLLKLTSTTGTGLEKDVYTVSLSADDIKNALGVTSTGQLAGTISYRANKSDSSASVSLEKGLDFTNGANTVASVAADGVVTFDLKDTLTGIKSISNVKSGVGTTLTLSSTANEVNVNGAKVKGVADGEAPTDAVNKGQLDKLAQRIGTGTTGTNGTADPAGKDGLDGADGKPPQSLTEKVNALRNGTAGNMVYTAADANGVQERLVMEGGKFYRAAAIDTYTYAKAIDGKWYRKDAMDPNTGIPNPEAQPVAFADVFKANSDKNAVATENVNISAVNANGKVTDATPLLNIASALGILPSAAVDASNAKALGGEAITATAAKLVVGSAADKTGIYSAKGAALTQGVTLADLQAVAQAGLDFTGNSIENSKEVAVHAPINSTVKIAGKSTYDANTYDEGDNISTKVDAANKQILITMKKKPSFDSVTVGKTDKQVTLGTDEEGNLHLSDKEGTSPNDKVVLNGLKDGKTADSAVTKGALDALKAQIGGNGATGATGAQGNVGPAGKDGLDGHSLTDKVEGLRDGLAGNMVYTNSAGDRLVKDANGYYKVDELTAKNLKQANNGLWYPKANVKTDGNLVDGVAENSGLTTAAAITANNLTKVTDVQISTVNADGTTTNPTVLRNVDSTLSLKKAGNVPTTADEAWADKFVNGGNNGDTNKTANDAKGLLGLTGSVLTNGATLGELQAVAQSGIDFKGDTTKIASGTYVHAPIGSTVDIVGGGYTQTDYNSNKYTSDNLATYVDAANKQIRIMMKTNPTFATATLGSGENAVTLTPGKKADGTTTLTLKDGKAEPNNKVVLTGLAPDNTDRNSAVTLGQLLDRTASLGNDGVDGANGLVGPAGKDGLNGQSLGTQINNLRTGTAGNMVYTIDKGDNDKTQVRLLTDGTKFVREDKVIEYTQVDGKWYHKNDVPGGVLKANAKVVPLTEVLAGLNAEDVSKINISSVNVNGKVTEATPLMNIAGALGDDVGNLQKKSGAALNQAVTVGDLKLVADQGITFGGNQMVGGNQKTIAVGLGKTLSVKGAATDYTPTGFGGENLYTTVDDYTINIKMKKSPVFTGVTVGETGKQVDITTDKDGNLKLTDKENTGGSDKVVLTGLKDGTTPDSAVTKGALDALKASITGGRDGANGINGTPGTGIAGINGEKGHDGKDGIDGTLGKVGPSGKDGLAGHNIYDKIEAQREGLSGNMVYTDGEGNRVVKVEGVYYKASAFDNFKQAADGKWYPKAAVDADGKVTDPSAVGKDIRDLALENGDSYVPVNQVVISTVNPIGETTEPTAIGNVKSNLASATLDSANDNPVGTASEVATKAMIGLGDADGATDLERKGLLGVTDKDVLNHAATVGDLQTVARAGMTFQTNDKPAGVANTAPQTIHKALGETLTIIGKEDAQYRTLEQLTATLTSKYAAELTPKLKAEGRSDEYIQKEITKAVTEAATSAMRNGTTYSANNLVTTVTADGKIQIAMADSPTFKAATVGDAALTFIKDPVHKLGYVQVSYRDGGEPGTGVDGVIVQGLRTSSDPTSAATKGYVDNKLNGSAVVTAPDVINSPSSGDHFEQSGMGIQVLALRNGVSGPVVYTSKTGERAMRITQVSFADDGKLKIGEKVNVRLSALDNYKLATNASGTPMGWYEAGADIWKEEIVSDGKGGTITTKTNQLKDGLTKEQLEAAAIKLDPKKDIVSDKLVLSLVSDNGQTESQSMVLHNVDSGLSMLTNDEAGNNKSAVASLIDANENAHLHYAANLEDLKALAEAGMDFTANAGNLGTDKNGATVHRNLGEALQIIGATGGDWNKFDTKNIMTYAEDGIIKVGMAKAPTFEGLSLQGINGKDGEDGQGGKAGEPGKTITLTPSADGKTITIQGPKGLKGDDAEGKPGKVVIDGLTTGDKDDSAATKGYVDKAINGLNSKDGTGINGSNGSNGVAGQDGLNGKSLAEQVLAGRDGLTGSMIYTDKDGNRLVRDGDNFYTPDSVKNLLKEAAGNFYDKNKLAEGVHIAESGDHKGKLVDKDGNLIDRRVADNAKATAPEAVNKDAKGNLVDGSVIISAIDPNTGEATKPTVIGNVKSFIGNDAPNGKAIEADAAKGKMDTLLKAEKANLGRVATVGDLQAVAQAGLDFTDNAGNAFHRTLGSTVAIKGGFNNKYDDTISSDNIATKVTTEGIEIGMKKAPTFTALTIKGENGKDGADGSFVTISAPTTDDNGNQTIVIKGNNGKDGADSKNGKVIINGLTTGDKDDSAATKGYVDKAINGLNSKDGTGINGSNGSNGAAGQDGLNGKSLAEQVLAGRDGLTGSMIYTDKNGNRLVRDGDNFYTPDSVKNLLKDAAGNFYDKNKLAEGVHIAESGDHKGKLVDKDGNLIDKQVASSAKANAPKAVNKDENGHFVDGTVVISAIDPNTGEATKPTVIGNVKSFIGNDAPNGKAIEADAAKGKMDTLLKAEKASLGRVATVGDLQAVAQAGLDFGTNIEGTDGTIHRALGTKLDIKGADANKSWDAFSDTNLMTKLDGEVLRIGMKKSPVFNSIVIGGDPIGGKGAVTLNGKDGKLYIGKTDTANNQVLTKGDVGNIGTVSGNYSFNLKKDGKTITIKSGDTINLDSYLTVTEGEKAGSRATMDVDTTGLVKQSDFETLNSQVTEINKTLNNQVTEINNKINNLSKLQPKGTIGTGQESDLQAVSGETVRDYLDKNYTNNAVLNQRLTKLSKQANAGTASAMAAAAIPQVTNMYDDNLMIGAGTGVYGGESAVAIGVSGTNDNRDRTYRISTTYDSTGKWGLSAGIGFSIGSGKNTPKPSVARALSERVDRLEAENKELRETNQTEIKDLAAKNDQLQKQVQELQAMLKQLVPQVQATQAANAATQAKTADEDAEQPAALAPATH